MQTGNLPDFSFKYQHDPHSVAQFLYEILASSEKGILSKVGQGLVDSVDIDLSVYTGKPLSPPPSFYFILNFVCLLVMIVIFLTYVFILYLHYLFFFFLK